MASRRAAGRNPALDCEARARHWCSSDREGGTTAVEAARKHDLTVAEIESWKDTFCSRRECAAVTAEGRGGVAPGAGQKLERKSASW